MSGKARAEMPTSDANRAENSAWVMQSLEAGQLASARAKHYPRRQLKRSEAILFWGLRIYLAIHDGSGLLPGLDHNSLDPKPSAQSEGSRKE